MARGALEPQDRSTPIHRRGASILTRVVQMKLRFAADRRALFWSLVLFPVLPAIAFAAPRAAPWLIPFGLYLGYCAGVLTHNHMHCPVFQGKRWNSAYSAWLSIFYGSPIFVWMPTHNQNHHRYLNGPGDHARTVTLAPNDTLWAAFSYPTRSAISQAPAIVAYARAAAREKAREFGQIVAQTVALILAHLALLSLAISLYGLGRGIWLYGCAVALPALFAPWAMMFTNYVQHAGCDPDSKNDHSRNFVSPRLNWWLFQAGYHTVHHESPASHWSLYPALHAARVAEIAPHLNQRTIFGYCLKTYSSRTEPALREIAAKRAA